MKHSKGPWKTLFSSNKYISIHSGSNNVPVAVLYEHDSENSAVEFDNAEANAKLIAAAPDMLKLIKYLSEYNLRDEKLEKRIRAILKKVNG